MSDQTNNQVIIYTTTNCAFCATEKQWLDHLGVQYEARNIEEDDDARDELLEKLDGVFQGTPTTDIGGQMIVGFNRPALQTALVANNLLPSAA